MKIRKFNVVELKDNNKATILDVIGNRYKAEIVNCNGITVDNRVITNNEINKVIYPGQKGMKSAHLF